MESFRGQIYSKLPQTPVSIFAVMGKHAIENQAINLSQGFPDFPISTKLIDLVNQNMKAGHNQYAPMPGVPNLREQIVKMFEDRYAAIYHPEKEITITAGATQALYSIISAFIRENDEVIIFEPAYDSYAPAIRLNKGIVRPVSLQWPDYHINWDEVTGMITANTRMIIINTPHNPTGTIWTKEDIQKLESLTQGTDIIVLSDEVYEHLIFDDHQHLSIASFPKLAERSFVVGSFGKTFHATGWKMGFCLAPENLMAEYRKTHQFTVFTCNTPIQMAIGTFLEDKENYIHLGEFYQKKRDFFSGLMKSSRFKEIYCGGTYFQLFDYSRISDEAETDFAIRLTKEFKVASIPISVFYSKETDNKVLRFCFAKKEETLEKAAEILCKI